MTRFTSSILISSSTTNPRQHWKKINIRVDFSIVVGYASPHFHSPFISLNFSAFSCVTCVTTDEAFKRCLSLLTLICDLDPISTTLLKTCSRILLPTITNINNLSIIYGIFPDQFKSCSVYILTLKNLAWITMISVIIILYLASLSYQN